MSTIRIRIRSAAVFAACMLAASAEASDAVERSFVNPANGYTQVVTVTAGPTTTLYVSGQIGDGEGLEAQLRAAWTSLGEQLRAGGAEFADLVKINTYIVDYGPDDLDTFRKVRDEFLAEENRPASTLIGVKALALPRWKVEIEAIAVVPAE